MTKMLSASGGLRPPDQGLCPPDPRYRLVLRTLHGAPQPLTPSAAYGNCLLPRYVTDENGIGIMSDA